MWSVLLAVLSSTAWAGPPFVTDDPEPVELGHHELYLSSQITLAPDVDTASLPLLEFNYGAFPQTQLHVVAPMAYSKATGAPARYGYGDTELGVKYRFLQETAGFPQIGIFPLVELPTGNQEKGLGTGKAQLFLPLWLQKSWGEWSTYGGGGWWSTPGDGTRNFWRLGWQVQRKVGADAFLGIEVFRNTSSGTAPALTGANLGGQVNFGEHVHALFSGGHSLDANRQSFGYLGVLCD